MDTFISKIFSKFNISKKEVLSVNRFFPNRIPDDLQPFQKEAWEVYLKTAIISIANSIEVNFESAEYNAPNGVYQGTAGIAYMFYRLSKIPAFKDIQYEFLRKAQDFIKPAINFAGKNSHKTKMVPSLLLGHAGVYAVSACIYYASDIKWMSTKYFKQYMMAREFLMKETFLKCGSDELFVGRAGYILGELWLSRELGKAVNVKELHQLCDVMVKYGLEYSKRCNSPCPLMYSYYKKEYIGAAHGLTSILLALLSAPDYLNTNAVYATSIKETVDYVLSLQDQDGNFPPSTTNKHNNENDLTQWCHGASGVIYLMAKAYLIWRENKYLESCELAADNIWKKGLLTKGPGLCHGISGNAYAFLLMYRLTHDQKYLNKAYAFTKFMEGEDFKKDAKIPEHPFSLFEGIAGTALFLSDLLYPNDAYFPFMDVFSVYSVYISP